MCSSDLPARRPRFAVHSGMPLSQTGCEQVLLAKITATIVAVHESPTQRTNRVA